MNIKRHSADRWFSLVIRTRDGWACRSCGRSFEPGSAQLQCAHIWSRRHTSTRWHPGNAVSLCFSCHQTFGENPLAFNTWVFSHASPVPNPHTAKPIKRTQATLDSAAKFYRTQYRAMLEGADFEHMTMWPEILM
jgi:hypothetical protein